MERLSPEVLSLIAAQLYTAPEPSWPPAPRLPFIPYACISRAWQQVCEPHVFANIRLKSPDLPHFAEIFSEVRRRAALRRLKYSIRLPTYGESRADHRTNIAAFTTAVHALLELLGMWACDGGGLALSILLHEAEDMDSDMAPPPRTPLRWLRLADDDQDDLSQAGLPAVLCIAALSVPVIMGRPIHPSTMCRLAGAMPHLESLDLEVMEPKPRMAEMRRRHREAFAAGLMKLNTKMTNLKTLKIRNEGLEPHNHSFRSGNLEDSNGIDRLSEALRIFTQSCPALARLYLENIIIAPELFCPLKKAGTASSTDDGSWPTLRTLNIIASRVTPSGGWYYTGDPHTIGPGPSQGESPDSDDSSTEDLSSESDLSSSSSSERASTSVRNGVRPTYPWRTRPDPVLFDPLVESLAGAVLRMPKLKQLEFEMAMWLSDHVGIMFETLEAGEASSAPPYMPSGHENQSVRRWNAWIGAASDWEVPSRVEQLWKKWLHKDGQITVGRWPSHDP